jgi:predicted nucleic acid-binding protein
LLLYVEEVSGCLILSNDKLLRTTARQRQIEIHGTLWVLDCFHEKELVPSKRLCQALKHLQKGNFRRLPLKEIELHLQNWD